MTATTLTPQSSPGPARVTGLPSLALRLTRARLSMRQGEGVLYLASVFAFAISSALALTVAGGTVMFFQRWRHPTGVHLDMMAADPTFVSVLSFYFILAIVACALLIPTMAGLASGAAVLGARSRDRRLAVMRLVGLSSADVTRMSLIDTAIQAVAGIVVGVVVYLVTLPAWGLLTMQAIAVRPGEMLLPWWGILAVCAATFATGLFAAAWGLRGVRISPLGVSRRSVGPALKVWRVLVFAGLLIVTLLATQLLDFGASLLPWLIFAAIMIATIWGFNLFAAWILQLLARAFARLPNPTGMWAARRIQAEARTTWRRVAGMGLLALIGAYISVTPISFSPANDDPRYASFLESAQWDFTKGAIITLGVGFVLTATAIFIAQASAILERAEQSLALANMGAPTRFLTRVTWWETLAPLVVGVVMGAGLGLLLALPFITMAANFGMDIGAGLPLMGGVLVLGIGLAVVALVACGPLQTRVLATQERRND